MRLGVNIDHIATLRQARGTRYPNPLAAAALAEKAGADQITIHLREDRRHIQDEDLQELRRSVQTLLNLEMAATSEMLSIACHVKPDIVTLVPEKREEKTTESGLDVVRWETFLSPCVEQLQSSEIEVSLFIDPNLEQLEASIRLGVDRVEFHTGNFAEAYDRENFAEPCRALKNAAEVARRANIAIAAGHGLNYDNTEVLVRNLPEIEEYNIGHSIVSRSVFVGLEQAVKEMKEVLQGCRHPQSKNKGESFYDHRNWS